MNLDFQVWNLMRFHTGVNNEFECLQIFVSRHQIQRIEKRSATIMLRSSSLVGESDELEVESENKLHWPAARIVRGRNILIGVRDQPEVCSRITRCLQTKIGRSQFWIINC